MTVFTRLVVSLIAVTLMPVKAPASAATGLPPVHIAGSHWVGDAPTKVADALDLFNRDGATPRIQIGNHASGKDAVDALLADEAEFALAASTPVAAALLDWRTGPGRDESPPLVVLAAVSLSNRTHVVVANSDAGIETSADFAGKRVALMSNTSGHFGWQQFADYHGLTDDVVTLVNLSVADHAAAIADGRVDAAAIWEPWASQLAEQLGTRARVFSTRHLYTVAWLLVTRRDVLADHPGIASRVLTAYRDAIDFIDAYPGRAHELHAAASSMDAAALRPLVSGIVWALSIDWAVVADMESQLRWLAGRRGIALENVPAPYHYLQAGPLYELSPRRVTVPPYFFRDGPVPDRNALP